MNPGESRLPDPRLLQALIELRDRAQAARSLPQLAFTLANDLYALLPFRQALVLAQREGGALELMAVSGLAMPEEDSPYLVWLRRAARWLAETQLGAAPQPRWLERSALNPPPEVAEGWAQWWSAGLLCVPLHAPGAPGESGGGPRLALLLFQLEAPPDAGLLRALAGLWPGWAYCWAHLQGRRPRWRLALGRHWRWALPLALTALLLLPVRQTALAPAEIVSREAHLVSAPIDGVVKEMLVRPNQAVAAGTPLFALDDTSLHNRAEVLAKQVAVADAELMAASQRAFDNPQSKGELALLGSRAQQRRAELAEVQGQLKRTQVLAPRAGVAVFGDPNDWRGRPVATGERVLLVADPAQPALRIQLAVADAIALQPGARVTLFLSADPLHPLEGQVLETSYQAQPSEDGVAAYRLLASLAPGQDLARARLGLHGTAKLHGERVLLGYYLLRRPLASLRAWIGL